MRDRQKHVRQEFVRLYLQLLKRLRVLLGERLDLCRHGVLKNVLCLILCPVVHLVQNEVTVFSHGHVVHFLAKLK